MPDHRDSKAIRRTIYVAFLLLAAAVLALAIGSALHVSSSGRDFRPHLVALASLLFPCALLVRHVGRWPWLSLISGLALVEFAALLIIGYFSGSTGPGLFSQFNLSWLAYITLFLGIPWLAGAALSDAIQLFKSRRGSG